MMDTVSGAEVPEPEIVVSPAMIEKGIAALEVYIGRYLGHLAAETVEAIYIAMRRDEIAEVRTAQSVMLGAPENELIECQASMFDGECVHSKCPVDWKSIRTGADPSIQCPLPWRRSRDEYPPPGYRNAGEDEPERTAGWKP